MKLVIILALCALAWAQDPDIYGPPACADPGIEYGYVVEPPPFKVFFPAKWLTVKCKEPYAVVGKKLIKCYLVSSKFGFVPGWSKLPKCVACKNLFAPDNGGVSTTAKLITVGGTIKWTCNEGYSLFGAKSATCLDTGIFDEKLPKCILKTCENPGPPKNGFIKPTGTVNYGQIVQYTCKHCYRRNGPPSAVCKDRGMFFPPMKPTCDLITCLNFKPPTYGSVDNDSKYINCGSKITWSCNTGYNLIGKNSAVCQADGTFGGTKPPTCKLVTCENLGAPMNGFVDPDKDYIDYAKIITWTCKDCYKLVGKSFATCQADGVFNPNMRPMCALKKCKTLGAPLYGSVDNDDDFINCGSKIVWSCNKGYKFIGKYKSATCQDDGTFGDAKLPICKLVTCENLGAPVNGNVMPDDDYIDYNKVIVWGCNKCYRREGNPSATCQANGEFDPKVKPKCILKQCKNFKAPANGMIAPAAPYINCGSKITWTCNTGYKLIGKRTMATCQDDGSFDIKLSEIPRCQIVQCKNLGPPDYGTVFPVDAYIDYLGTIKWGCKKCYKLFGKYDTSTCQATGFFQPSTKPECKLTYCKNPGAPRFGSVKPAVPESIACGSMVYWKCDAGFVLGHLGKPSATCLPDGRFDSRRPVCKRIPGCNRPSFDDRVVTIAPDQQRYKVGDVVTYTCIDAEPEDPKNMRRRCLSNGRWSGQEPTCYYDPYGSTPAPYDY